MKNLRKALDEAAGRLIGKLVPSTTASADQYECSYSTWCQSAFLAGCWIDGRSEVRYRQLICSDGSKGPKQKIGCC